VNKILPVRYSLIAIAILALAGCIWTPKQETEELLASTGNPKTATTTPLTVANTPTASPTLTLTPLPLYGEKYEEPGNYIDTILVDGKQREFMVHLPPTYNPDVSMPLVLNLHAYTHTKLDHESMTQLSAKADQEGFIVVYPQAQGDPPRWDGQYADLTGQTDRAFFHALLAHLRQYINIDPARIYVAGFSNGAEMAVALGCFMSDTFAAIASVAGKHVEHALCYLDRPVSILIIHGTADAINPLEGNEWGVSLDTWVAAWRGRNGCNAVPDVEHPFSRVTKRIWKNCKQNVEVVLYLREGGEHIWPGSEEGNQREGIEADLIATDIIWEFFEEHARSSMP